MIKKVAVETSPDEVRIVLAESWDNQRAVLATGKLAARAGFGTTDQAMIATAASELSTNILRYAVTGELVLRIVHDNNRVGIELVATDAGPGINDIVKALEDHFTTTKGSLGLGLPSVCRIMDDFEIDSSPRQGTRVVARRWRINGKH